MATKIAKKKVDSSLVICEKCGSIMALAMDGVYNCNGCYVKGSKNKKKK